MEIGWANLDALLGATKHDRIDEPGSGRGDPKPEFGTEGESGGLSLA